MPWIGSPDDLADASLIETLVAVVALQNLEMRSDGPLAAEALCLLGSDQGSVNACLRWGKNVNGAIEPTSLFFSCSRSWSKSNWHSR
jgi:hypothetical protein